jgi:hypothetical protein
MNSRRVWKENDKIYSESTTEDDRTKTGGGVLKFTRKLEMDNAEAGFQLRWILQSVKTAKSEIESLKNSISREGLNRYQEEQRKKIKNLKSQLEEYEDLKTQYENAGIHASEIQQPTVPSI